MSDLLQPSCAVDAENNAVLKAMQSQLGGAEDNAKPNGGRLPASCFEPSVASQRYSSASDGSHNCLARCSKKERTSKKERATECGGSFRAMVDVCSLCDSVTYPLGSGGDHGYLAES